MDTETIFVYRTVIEKIKAHTEKTYPAEGCGVLMADDNSVAGQIIITDAYVIQNTAGDSRNRDYFSIDPITLLEAEKTAYKNKLTVAGFFHSHPDREAVPSAEDKRYMVPGQLYLIASVVKGVFTGIRGYLKKHPDETIREVKISECTGI